MQSGSGSGSGSSSSSALINQHFSQLGVPFVRDRSVCVLPACGVAVSRHVIPRKRRARVESRAAECAVCQDGAAGCEYGAAACDSCQNFFERTVRLHLIHDCHFRRGCDLRLNRRNHCLGCRWDRCLEVGMSPSTVKKRRNVDLGTKAWDLGHNFPVSQSHQALCSPQAATPQPSLPSLSTDTEDSNQLSCWGGGGDSADGERADGHLLDMSPPDLPISPALVRASLTLPGSPDSAANAEGLRACMASLERSCLVELYRWNKRRLVGYSERGFVAAAASWMPILVASAVRHYLGKLPPAVSNAHDVAGNLKGRLEQRIRGFDGFEANEQLDSLTAGIGDLCGHLLDGGGCGGASCQKVDSLAEVILMMGDLGEDELLLASLQSTVSSTSVRSSTLASVTQSLLAVTELMKSAKPELRALLLTALIADGAKASSVAIDYGSQQSGPDNSGSLSTGKECATRMPGLIGL